MVILLRAPNLLYKVRRTISSLSPEGVDELLTKIEDVSERLEGFDGIMSYEEIRKKEGKDN